MTAGERPGTSPTGSLLARPSGGLRGLLRHPAAELFEFEAERGRVRLGGMSPFARWLAVLGLATTGLLMVAVLLPGSLASGRSWTVPVLPRALHVHSGTTAVTLVLLAVAWELVIFGALRASRLVRVGTGVLFLLVNGSLAVGPSGARGEPGAVTAFWDVARAGIVVASAGLVVSALRRRSPGTGLLPAAPLLRWVTSVASFAVFASLLVVERAGRTSPHVGISLAGDVASTLETVILLLAPLLYLTGMAMLSLSYAVGAAASEVADKLRAPVPTLIVVGLIAAEAWFYGWRGRSQLWPGSRGWVVLLHVLPALAGFGAVVYAGRKALEARAEPVHDNASLAVALLVAVPSIAGGLYQALWSTSTLGFLHVPPVVSSALWSYHLSFNGVVDATGPRCVLFGAVAAAALAAAAHGGLGIRKRQFAVGLALMSGWVFWTLFVDWLPDADTADGNLLALVALGLLAAYVAGCYALPKRRPPQLSGVVGALVVLWAFAAVGAPLRQLGNLVPLEGAVVLVVGVLLILVGKSQFTGGTSPSLPRASRVVIWTGYILLSLIVIYWDREVGGFFDFGGRLTEVSVLKFVAVPYLTWLVISGRFRAPREARRPAVSTSAVAAELELEAATGQLPVGVAEAPTSSGPGRRRAVLVALSSAAALCAAAFGAYAIDTAGRATVAIAEGVSITAAPHWTLSHGGTVAVAIRRHPWGLLAVVVESSYTGDAGTDLSKFAATQHLTSELRMTDATLIRGGTGNFSEVELAHAHAVYRGRAVVGNVFSFLAPKRHLMAAGMALAYDKPSYKAISGQMASMLNSLDELPRPALW